MKFAIEKCVAWYGNIRTTEDWQLWAKGELEYSPEDDLPPLKQIPPMQRRRLSPFAKFSFHCILESLGNNISDIPCVFSSRHGDLHKTAKLIEDVATKSDLSPTNFGLSVHNAVAGLYSIFAKNKQAMTAISAGEDSLMMAVVDAYAKLESQNLDQVLVVYTDQIVPEQYNQFVSDKEQTLAIAFVLSKAQSDSSMSLSFEPQTANHQEDESFQPLEFLKFIHGKNTTAAIQSTRYQWQMSRNLL
ncbi:beta-ketoacyl synthase chain length factor [Pseudocolwellia sp. HL-MZ7]|uniref:beta-ketoacyl synthase chain length factor n=1 Tax=Pseudocolwellia sp. HL-MZ7 TaxID=3400627 RepID=UPI003CE88B37